MTNSSRPRESNQVVCRVYVRETNISKEPVVQSMRNTNDTLELEFRNRRRSARIGCEGRHASRRPRSNFRFGIFGSIRNPFSRCRRAALAGRSTSTGIPSIPSLRAPRPVTLVRSGTPCVQFYCLRRSSVTETRAREEQTATRRGTESGERPDFQMDINSSACSTPRSSLITPLQLLSLIKASGPAGA